MLCWFTATVLRLSYGYLCRLAPIEDKDKASKVFGAYKVDMHAILGARMHQRTGNREAVTDWHNVPALTAFIGY